MRHSRTIRAGATAVAVILTMAALALLAAGCGGSNTPTSATQDMLTLLANRDFGGAYDAFANSSQIRSQVSRDDFIKQMGASLPEGTTLSDINVTNEQIDGDKATVSWTATVKSTSAQDQPLTDSFAVVKEDDSWKVDQ
ncbi:MAG: Rv0361 family membrane protein [Thermoleophilia bacterium]